MDISKWSGIAVAIIAAGAAIFQSRRRSDPRGRIKADIEILTMLQGISSEQAEELRKHVDRQVKELIDAEARKRRDLQGVGVAAFLLVLAGAIGYLGWQTEGLWRTGIYVLAALIALIAIYGFGMSIGKAHRDASGNRIPAPAD